MPKPVAATNEDVAATIARSTATHLRVYFMILGEDDGDLGITDGMSIARVWACQDSK